MLVEIAIVAGGAIWVVGSIRTKTAELSISINALSKSIEKLDIAVLRLDSSVRDLDRRVTRIEALQEFPYTGGPVPRSDPNDG